MKAWCPVPRGRLAVQDGITFYPVERLGNQLFGYAACLAQARRLGVPCYVNRAWYDYVRPQRTYTIAFELGVFDNGLIVPEDSRAHLPVFLGLPAARGSTFWHHRIGPHLPASGPPVYFEGGFRYEPQFRQVRPGTTVIGMFQSWKYFDDIGEELRERMTQLTDASPWIKDLQARLRPGSGNIALHVRRGDYALAQVQATQGLTRAGFYLQGLAHLRRLGMGGPVFVASDSFEAVDEELGHLGPYEPLQPPAGVSPFEVVIAMSLMDGLVTANSSFSWWAGYLGRKPGQVVIAPRPWFTDAALDTRDLLPPDWLTLDRDGPVNGLE